MWKYYFVRTRGHSLVAGHVGRNNGPERISAATFRRWFLIFLAILGLELVVRPFFL
jgi:hypothetical protein